MVRVSSTEQRGPQAGVRRIAQRKDLLEVLSLRPGEALELPLGQEVEPVIGGVAIEIERVDTSGGHLGE